MAMMAGQRAAWLRQSEIRVMSRHPARLVVIALLFMSSCAAPPPPPPSFPDIRFTDSPPLQLDVTEIGLYGTFQPSNNLPEIDNSFPVPPVTAIQNWVHDRLAADNPTSSAQARVTILDATVRQVALKPTTTGIENVFTKEQAYRYDGHAAARIEIYDKGMAVRTATVETSLSRSIAEGSTLNDRDQLWYAMSRDMAENLGKAMETQIRANFPPYARAQ